MNIYKAKKKCFILLAACGICLFIAGCIFIYIFRENDYDLYKEYTDLYEDYRYGRYENYDSTQNEEDKFIKKVVINLFSTQISWVSLYVESPEYKGKAVIYNDFLYKYMIDNNFFTGILNLALNIEDELWYTRTMYGILKEKSALKIEKKGDFDKYGFHIVPNDTSVIENAKKGFEHFIETYTEGFGAYHRVLDKNEKYDSFTKEELKERYGKLTKKELFLKGDLILKRDLSDDKRNAVISQFFDFKIMVIRDCESGQLMVYK